jgi:hypothetical protein
MRECRCVIAALLLKMMWERYLAGTLQGDLQTAAFTVFLWGGIIGCARRIEDPLHPGRSMDTCTATSKAIRRLKPCSSQRALCLHCAHGLIQLYR